MARRLILDTLRRLWMVCAMALFFLAMMAWLSRLAATDGATIGVQADPMAWALGMTWFLAFMPTTFLEAREIAMLPISRRRMWIVRWSLAVVVFPSLIGVALALSAAAGAAFGGATVALTLLYCTLYGGCFMALTAVIPFRTVRTQGWLAAARIIFHIFGMMLGGAALPFAFARYLPHSFATLGGPMNSILIAALGMTLASFFYQPPIIARASRPHFKRLAEKNAAALAYDGGLTGLSLLVWRETRRTVLTLAGSLAGMIVISLLMDSTATVLETLRSGRTLLFAPPPTGSPDGFPILMMLLVAGIPSNFDFITDVRRLRLLPWSTLRLAAMLTAAGFWFAVVLWTFLLAPHLIFVHAAPDTLRPGWFLLVAGGTAMMQTVRLAVPKGATAMMMGAMFVGMLSARFVLAADARDTGMFAGLAGAVLLIASCLINQWALRNSSRVYKHRPMTLPFGGTMPGQGRT